MSYASSSASGGGGEAVDRGAPPAARVRPLPDSHHVATLDNDAPEIFDGILAFITQHSSPVQASADNPAEKRV